MNISIRTRFKPKLHYEDIEYFLKYLEEVQIENDEIYGLLEKLTDIAYPTTEDQYDKRWEYFYVPIERDKKTIVIPMWIMKYNEEFFGSVQSFGNFHIKKGNKDTEKFYRNIFTDTLRFISIIKKDESSLQKILPYDIRRGKIKGRYVLDKLLSQSEKKTILEKYEKRRVTNVQQDISDISLNDYLNVAAICYNAAYKEEAKNLSPIELYQKWADGRDGGMLSINDWNSKKEFSEWHKDGQLAGHPFEIVFSWHIHGIHLYPPNNNSHLYIIRVSNYAYAWNFLEMVNALIEMKIPFESQNLDDVLNFLTGDTYFTVNGLGEYDLKYIPSKEYKQKYFPHIIWDEIKIVKWKTNL